MSQAAQDLERLLSSMKQEIDADRAKMKEVLQTPSQLKPPYKPRFVQKSKPKVASPPQPCSPSLYCLHRVTARLLQAASDLERRKDASRQRRRRELRDQELPQRSKSTGALRRNGSIEDRLQTCARSSVMKRERLLRELQQPEEVQSSPHINPTSQSLSQNVRNPNERIEDRLLRLGKQIEAARLLKQQAASPRRVQGSASEVTERLMQYQRIYSDHKLLLMQEHRDSPPWRPVINKQSERLVQRRKTPPAVKKQPESFSFKPQTNKRSSLLAKKLGTSRERLLSPRRLAEHSLPECTFQPSTNSKTSPSGAARWEALYQLNLKQREQQALLQLQARTQAESLAGCTFKPAILPVARTREPVVSRLLDWQQGKQTKLIQQRQQRQLQNLEECTFSPTVSFTQFYAAKDWRTLPAAKRKPALTYSAPLVQLDRPLVVETRETMQPVGEDSGELSRILAELGGP